MDFVGPENGSVGPDELALHLHAQLWDQSPALYFGGLREQALKRRANGGFVRHLLAAIGRERVVISLNGLVSRFDGSGRHRLGLGRGGDSEPPHSGG